MMDSAQKSKRGSEVKEEGTVRIVRKSNFGEETADDPKHLIAGSNYYSIHFSGCGFMLPYHFGTVAAMQEFGITFTKATASSGGVMAALALLEGAELHLGIRQCFDLRGEKATTPTSIRSFFAVYREYFRCFRSPACQRRQRLANLRHRLFVRLGRWTKAKGWEVYQVTDFESEQDLEDAFMSAAYVPLGTSVVPPYFRGTVAYDAALVDFLSGQIGFAAAKASLWPPEPLAGQPGDGVADRTKVLVVPTRGWGHSINPNELVVVNGKFRSLLDFWAHPSAMRRGFVEGFQMVASLIDPASLADDDGTGGPGRKGKTSSSSSSSSPSSTPFVPRRILAAREARRRSGAAVAGEAPEAARAEEARLAAEELFAEVMAAQSTWKERAAFVKPPLFFERDPLLALFLAVAALVFLLSVLWQQWLLVPDDGTKSLWFGRGIPLERKLP